jgi:TPR repeat protein
MRQPKISLFARLDEDCLYRTLVAAADTTTINTLSLLNSKAYNTLFIAKPTAYSNADQKNLYFLRGKKALADYRHCAREDWFTAYQFFIQSYDIRYPERQWMLDNFECIIISNVTTSGAKDTTQQAHASFTVLIDFFKKMLADSSLSTDAESITHYMLGRAIYHHATSCYGVFSLHRAQDEQRIVVQQYLDEALAALVSSVHLGCYKALNLQFEIYTGLGNKEKAEHVLDILLQHARNDAQAQFHAGQIYQDKWLALTEGVDTDALCQETLLNALHYLSLAAAKGHVTAQVRLMNFAINTRYQERLQSTAYSPLRAKLKNHLAELPVYEQQLLNASHQGHLEAQFEHAVLQLRTINTRNNSQDLWQQVMNGWQAPAERNYVYAQMALYRYSDSTNINSPQQAQVFSQTINDYWLLQLAQNGVINAQLKLAAKLIQHTFTAFDKLRGEQQQPTYWYQKAAALTTATPSSESPSANPILQP